LPSGWSFSRSSTERWTCAGPSRGGSQELTSRALALCSGNQPRCPPPPPPAAAARAGSDLGLDWAVLVELAVEDAGGLGNLGDVHRGDALSDVNVRGHWRKQLLGVQRAVAGHRLRGGGCHAGACCWGVHCATIPGDDHF
jgi:hypothetical protein